MWFLDRLLTYLFINTNRNFHYKNNYILSIQTKFYENLLT